MMNGLEGKQVVLRERKWLEREARNRAYMMKLENRYLLRNYYHEAGLMPERGIDTNAMGGWEAPFCQLRGHFLGHWLSAAAFRVHETGDREIEAKACALVDELARCQRENGNGWAAPIPEKYLIWIGRGKSIWAPQYTIHKLLMGLCDVYRYLRYEPALAVADGMGDWFLNWSAQYSREEFDQILDVETGGMLEVWADLLSFTGNEKYRTLLSRYYRGRLFDPLLAGKDVLTNMHANTTIPEVLGCARAWEVTGEPRWLEIVEAYWRCAVTERGCFATGGQTQGEIWTPKQKFKARLGDKNQEHCTVYNMIRLADFLFRRTGDPAYAQYIEYNLMNGVFAQTYWQGDSWNGSPDQGLLTYFLPLKAGSRKDWAGEMDSFFCCHGTMVQANAALNRYLCYQDADRLCVAQYADADVCWETNGAAVRLEIRQDYMNGSLQQSSVNDALQTPDEITSVFAGKPDFRKYVLTLRSEKPFEGTLCLRIPEWISGPARIRVNGTDVIKTEDASRLAELKGPWRDGDRIELMLPIGLKFIPLPDDPETGAFRYGPDVLAGITSQERVLSLESGRPEDELSADTERQWGEFRTFYRTENQDPGISLIKLNEIGYQPYQVYFRVRQAHPSRAESSRS